MKLTLGELAELVHGTLNGEATECVSSVKEIEFAEEGDVSFLANPKYARFLAKTKATCVLVDADHAAGRNSGAVIVVTDPYSAFMQVQRTFAPPLPLVAAGIHPTAVVADSAVIASDAAVGPYCVVGERVSIGSGSVLVSHVVVSDDVAIGAATTLNPNVTIYYGCRIGNNVTIHAGTVIGADGFGFTEQVDGTYAKILQLGIVVIEDNVEIGANCTIDRATIGETRIGRGCKIDNLVMIAHNVSIGENSLVVAQVGISGSTKIGEHVILAGQAGIVGHIELSDHVIVGAQSGVSKSLTKPGFYRGSPAKEHGAALREEVLVRQLPELVKEIRALSDRVKELESKISGVTTS